MPAALHSETEAGLLGFVGKRHRRERKQNRHAGEAEGSGVRSTRQTDNQHVRVRDHGPGGATGLGWGGQDGIEVLEGSNSGISEGKVG